VTATEQSVDVLPVLHDLSEVPFLRQDRPEALKRIAQLGQALLGSSACVLTFVDTETRRLTYGALAGFDEEFEKRMAGQSLLPGKESDGAFLADNVDLASELVERYNLYERGEGVAHPGMARKYSLRSLLAAPLLSDGRLIGCFNHFTSRAELFSERDKTLLNSFARQAVLTIERFDYHRALERSVGILADLSASLVRLAPEDFIQQLPERTCELLSSPVCIIWKLEEHSGKLRVIAATADVDAGFRRLEIDAFAPQVAHLAARRVASLGDVRRESPHYAHRGEAEARGWVSLLTAPMCVGQRLIGMLDLYTLEPRRFRRWEKDLFRTFADQAAISIERAEVVAPRPIRLEITKIVHELASPIIGIQNNAAFMLHNHGMLTSEKTARKLEDILADSSLALAQVASLRHLFGGRRPASLERQVVVMRDVVFKSLLQLAPAFREQGIDFRSQVHYDPSNARRVVIWADPGKINQAVTSLLMNSIRYCGDPKTFELVVSLALDHANWIIRISDRGIGIPAGLEERIFEDGFRAPEARMLHVTGSGVGLTIARDLMKEMGGDLRLSNPRYPTSFDIVVPRSLERRSR